MMRIGILTVSDSRARATAEEGAGTTGADRSGDAIELWAELRGSSVAVRHLVADDQLEIARTLVEWCDGGRVDLVLTTGGTGLSPRDVTPEATLAAIERDAPGFAELLRVSALPHAPRAFLSRGIAGIRNATLIVNLPGSTRAVEHALTTLDPLLDHAIALLRGDEVDHR
jgi:molybdopterin adenylyltransferase